MLERLLDVDAAARPEPRGRRAAHRAAPRDDLALVLESDRHRARLRPRRRAAHRARQGLAPRGRCRAYARVARRARRAAVRPDDRDAARSTRARRSACSRRIRAARSATSRSATIPEAALARVERVAGTRALRWRDRLPRRRLRAAWPRSDRRRGDDVRAGEQRALPAQDLQCRLARRRRRHAALAVRHDPAHEGQESRRRAVRVQRQRGRDRGTARRRAISPPARDTNTAGATSQSISC